MAEIKILSDVMVGGHIRPKVDADAAPTKVATVSSTGAIAYRSVTDLKKDLGVNNLAGTYATKTELDGKLGKTETAEAAKSATNATNATKATNDSSNRNIVNTYATKSELTTGLGKKVDAVSGKVLSDNNYTDTEQAKVANLPTDTNSALNGKLNANKVKATALVESDDEVPTSKAVATYVKGKLTSVYKVMGSCTTAQLASKAKNKGDVWNLTDAGSYGGVGTNVVYNGSAWDALGGTIDLSGYATTGSVSTAQSKADSAYKLAEGKLDKSANAVSATKATNDSSNRNIVRTYATKTDLNTLAGRVSTLEKIPNANGRSY